MQTTPQEKLTISNLKFIAKIETGKRVNLCNYTLIDDGMVVNLLRRFVYRDSRWHTLNFIDNTINNAFEIARKYSRREDIQDKTLVTRIMEDIAASLKGINSLCETYMDDRKFVSDIHIIRDSIPAMISDFKLSLRSNIQPDDLLTTLLEIEKICASKEVSGMIFDTNIERPSTPLLVEHDPETETRSENKSTGKKKKGKKLT